MELQDKIGREDIVNKICSLVDNLKPDANFCLALNGEWGSGKTFVMQMLEQKFCEHPEYIVIKYDAWKNNFYSDPLIAILYCLLDSIPKKTLSKKDWKLVLRAVKQEVKNKIENSIDCLIKDLYNQGGWSVVCAFVIEIIKRIIIQAKCSILDNKLFDEYKSYQSLLNESIVVLNALTIKIKDTDKQRRLIILVDEIDRCLPNEQLVVLERLHHIFDIKNCAVIVALNKNAINANLKTQYGYNGVEYLRKFFSYNFIVETEYVILLSNLIKDFIDEINNSKKQDYVYTEKETSPLIDALQNEIGRISKTYGIIYSNRDIINYFKMFREVWEREKPLNIVYIGFLMFMMLYKQYEEINFQAYRIGIWKNDQPQIFNFKNSTRSAREYSFSYGGINSTYPMYENNFCNMFTSYMNSVRFRNDSKVFNWFRLLNSQNFYHLYICDEKDREIVENSFKKIENYGNMASDNKNERQ